MHVAFLISTLRAGGAERVITRLANGRAARGLRTSVITLEGREGDFYALVPEVTRRSVDLLHASPNLAGAIAANGRRVRALRREILELAPDVVVSFVDQMNVLALLACARTGIPCIVSERIDPRVGSPGAQWRALRTLLYPRAASVVVQTASVADWAGTHHPAWRTHVIPNPVEGSHAAATPVERQETIVGMGRLVAQKGFDLLIEAFARIAGEHPAWRLVIAGSGSEHAELTRVAARHGLGDRTLLPGTVEASRVLAEAGVFALPSRFEGFPNVLLEAMALGCPVVAYDCPSGPADIIRPDVDGLLVPPGDVPALAAALDRLIRDPLLRERLGAGAREVTRRFSLGRVLDEWEGLFSRVRGRAVR